MTIQAYRCGAAAQGDPGAWDCTLPIRARAHSTPDPDAEPPRDPKPNPEPDDVPAPSRAPVQEPRQPEPPIKAVAAPAAW
jgi:hypothetical protein